MSQRILVPPIDEVISDGETFTIDQQWENRAGRTRDYLRGICKPHEQCHRPTTTRPHVARVEQAILKSSWQR